MGPKTNHSSLNGRIWPMRIRVATCRFQARGHFLLNYLPRCLVLLSGYYWGGDYAIMIMLYRWQGISADTLPPPLVLVTPTEEFPSLPLTNTPLIDSIIRGVQGHLFRGGGIIFLLFDRSFLSLVEIKECIFIIWLNT